MKAALLCLAFFTTALISVCAPDRAVAAPGGPPDLVSGAWVVGSAAGPGSEAAEARQSLRVRFTPQGKGLRVGVSGGCNLMRGTVFFRAKEAVFGPLVSTLMACSPEEMAADAFVSKVFEGTVQFEIREETLVFRTEDRVLELMREPEGEEVEDPAPPVSGSEPADRTA